MEIENAKQIVLGLAQEAVIESGPTESFDSDVEELIREWGERYKYCRDPED